MNPADLQTELDRLGVTPPDNPLRSCLYLRQIQDTYTFFHTTLSQPIANGGLGTDAYDFVERAVKDPDLLNALCKALDDFVCPAINAHLRTNNNNRLPNFQTYYVNNFLNANYAANITGFFNTYVVTQAILTNIAQNFRRNIQEACERIYNDRTDIARAFASGSEIWSLTKIKSTGSDFHKGGKQVLILTFLMKIFSRPLPDSLWLNLIYKPSDIEVDCLIVGDSATVNAKEHAHQRPPFQVKSLYEIFNDGITNAKQNNPALSLELLPTYKILPMDYTSNQPVLGPGQQLNIRRAYGYIEFLQHYHSSGIEVLGLYPFGSSDYQIFPTQDSGAICRTFYRLIGQICAIASTFSISDLHVENLIVKNYLPYLIDLEISLTLPIPDIMKTNLFDEWQKGSIETDRKEDDFAFVEEIFRGNLQIAESQKAAYAQNRLMTVSPNALVDPADAPNPSYICKGLRDMMDVIQSVNTRPNNADLNLWLGRVNNVLVRNLPLATRDFRALLKSSANSTFCADVTGLGRIVDTERGNLFQKWQADNNLDPDFLGLQNNHILNDFNNGDIPIFYHRIGVASFAIVDSNGNEVTSPGNVSYRADVNAALQNAAYALPGGRTTFFAASPFQTNVVNGQLTQITNNATKTPRMRLLVGQILERLGLAYAAGDITTVLT